MTPSPRYHAVHRPGGVSYSLIPEDMKMSSPQELKTYFGSSIYEQSPATTNINPVYTMAKKVSPPKVAAATAPATPAPTASTPAPAAPAAETQSEPEVPAQPKQNGITRPKSGTATGKVWEIADSISAELQAPAPRAKVLAATKTAGINDATATTQYGRWRRFNGLKGRGTEPGDAAPASPAASEASAE